MVDDIPSGSAMRIFAFGMSDKVWNSLQHPLLNVFRYLSDIRQILLETQETSAARIRQCVR